MRSPLAFFKWGFFLLVAMNITLIVLFFLPKDDHPHGPPRFDRIIRHLDGSLGLSPRQHKQLVKLFERHSNEMEEMHRQSNENHNRMIDCLKYGDEDCNALNGPSGFDRLLFEHHRRILQILTSDQQKRYLADLDEHRPPGPPPF